MGKQFVANSLTSAIATEHVCIFAVSWLRSIFFVPKCLRFFFKLLLNQSDELGLYSETQLESVQKRNFRSVWSRLRFYGTNHPILISFKWEGDVVEG